MLIDSSTDSVDHSIARYKSGHTTKSISFAVQALFGILLVLQNKCSSLLSLNFYTEQPSEMAFERTAVVIFVCIAALAMSLSNALFIQEWGQYSSNDVKVYDDIEWFLPKQNGYREGKFNFPTLVGSGKHRKFNSWRSLNIKKTKIFTGRRRERCANQLHKGDKLRITWKNRSR